MKRLLLGLLLTGAAWGQPAPASSATAVVEAATRCVETAKASHLPRNVWVHFDVLRNQAVQLQKGSGNLDLYLRYFSSSRVLFWRSGPSGPAISAMGQLEQASQALAAASGRHLDLPPVGDSPGGTGPGGRDRLAPTDLLQTVRQAETLAQSLLETVRTQAPPSDAAGQRALQDMIGIAESARNLRVALEEGGNAQDRWQTLETNRARFLFSQKSLPPLDNRLPQLNDLLGQALESWRP